MRNNIHEIVNIVADQEIKAPALVHARLPEIPALVILLGSQGWMVQVLKQKRRLLVEGALDLLRCFGVASLKADDAYEPHHAERLVFVRRKFLASLCSEAMNSACVEKGPWTRPALMS